MSMQLPVLENGKYTQPKEQYIVVDSEYEKQQSDDEIDLRELLLVLRRRKGTILLTGLLIFIVGFFITLNIQPTYKATTTIQIEPEESANILSFDVAMSGESDNEFFQTQYELLKSRTLARKVIDDLEISPKVTNFDHAPSFSTEIIKSAKDLMTWRKEEIPNYELGIYPLESEFLSGLSIAPVKKSQIVSISYVSEDPKFATDAANSVATNFIEMTADRSEMAGSRARLFISYKLKAAEDDLKSLEQELTDYAKKESIIQTGDEKSQSLISQRTSELNLAFARSESERIQAESLYRQMQNSKSTSDALSSPTVQQHKRYLAELQNEYQKGLQTYKPSYPGMINLKRQINSTNARLNREITTITRASKNLLKDRYLASKEKEDKLRVELNLQKEGLLKQRDKGIQYNSLLRDLAIKRKVYEDLLLRSIEINIASGIAPSNIAIVDPAILPYKAQKPNIKLNMALSTVLGLFMGVVIAFLREFIDDGIKSSDHLKQLINLPILGIIPQAKGKDPIKHSLATDIQPASALAESYRSLRTNLLFSSGEGLPKVLAFTSAMPSEGKSSSCTNLAAAFAQANNKVLLVDADMRKPTVHKRLKLNNSQGLSNYLTHQAEVGDVIQETIIGGVSAITAGPLAPNPSELLSSERLEKIFELSSDRFDIVILDCPPVMGLADALILANKATATVLVSAFGQTSKRAVQDANERLKQARANLIGAIFTKVKTGGGYGYSYEYAYYSYGIDRLKN